jgi:hypothetical protein
MIQLGRSAPCNSSPIGSSGLQRRGAPPFTRCGASATEENELAAALLGVLEDCRREPSMEVHFAVTGDARDMHPIVRDEVYRIGYEAIRNACAHSKSTQLEVGSTIRRI